MSTLSVLQDRCQVAIGGLALIEKQLVEIRKGLTKALQSDKVAGDEDGRQLSLNLKCYDELMSVEKTGVSE